ncbi:MAG: formylglycine-generating enzyme family protein [Vicinamibacterales bacterium]
MLCGIIVLVIVLHMPTGHAATQPVKANSAGMVRIPAGSYRPLYTTPRRAGPTNPPRSSPSQRVVVDPFLMDAVPVTNSQFLAFVRDHPEWRRSAANRLFVDTSYLRQWRGDLDPGDLAPPASPVVYVSWFAARAYLKAQGKQLPTVDQWEYAAAASESLADASRDPVFLERLRIWYGRPTPKPLPPVGSTSRNVYGVRDLHGLVWEWTLDFNSALVTGESRADSALEQTLYCGSGGVGASDFEDYAAFMRYAFRSSLEARYGVANLGFRGVRHVEARP